MDECVEFVYFECGVFNKLNYCRPSVACIVGTFDHFPADLMSTNNTSLQLIKEAVCDATTVVSSQELPKSLYVNCPS